MTDIPRRNPYAHRKIDVSYVEFKNMNERYFVRISIDDDAVVSLVPEELDDMITVLTYYRKEINNALGKVPEGKDTD